jgi:hypothetical protein
MDQLSHTLFNNGISIADVMQVQQDEKGILNVEGLLLRQCVSETSAWRA